MSLEVKNLTKIFPKLLFKKKSFKAVDNLSFQIKEGEVYALLGPNGAGKTTTIKMIAGLVNPTSGNIMLDGHELNNQNKAYKSLSAVLEGTRNVYWRLTPVENLYYFANLRGIPSHKIKDKVEPLLAFLEIDAKKENQSQHLSRGMLQKLALAVALITEPKILLLDEPTLGLDVKSGRIIKDLIIELAKKQNKSVLLTTHQMDLVQNVADRVGIIRDGKIVKEGSLNDLSAVFHNFIYILKVVGDFSIPQKWMDSYGAKKIQNQDNTTELEINCEDNKDVYEILSFLREHNTEIISFSKVVDDLEEVFLRVLEAGSES
ncbi:MAG: ABC transporter ATP-binding protein [Leptospiraceae bacterium]|nr:ABC transporter ATP-binding protein [Leptospiraceae bacterium]MCP5493374.1 ABC transporter ATP-binding protein [Leptospiraceae bacterium]